MIVDGTDVLIPREGYCYETRGNGLTVEIIAPSGASVFFAQDQSAAAVVDSIHRLEKLKFPTGPWKTLKEAMNDFLSEYDYQEAGNDSL